MFEYLPYDLAGLIESTLTISHDHVRWYCYQLLRGIEYMHAHDFVHRCVLCRQCCAMHAAQVLSPVVIHVS